MNLSLNRLDRFVPLSVLTGVAGLCVTLLSLYVSNPYPTVLGPLVLLGTVAAYFLRDEPAEFVRVDLDTRSFLIGYLLVFGGVTALYVAAGHSRTLPIHVGFLGLYLLAFAGVFVLDREWLALAVVVATALLHRATMYYASALQVGIDAVWHTRIASEVGAGWSLDPLAAAGSKYWFMPLYHVTVATTSSTLGVSARDAAYLSQSVPLVVVPAVVLYAVLDQLGYARIGIGAAWLYLVADRVVAQSVHVIPTSTGILFAIAAFLAALRYSARSDRRFLALFSLALVGQFLTHPGGLFVTAVFLIAYLGGRALQDRTLDVESLIVSGSLVVAVAVQNTITKYNGPGGEETIVEYVTGTLLGTLAAGGGRAAASLPESANYVVTGTDSLPLVELVGVGLLYCLGVVGTLVWIADAEWLQRRVGFGIGAAVAALSAVIFVPPIFGINVLFSGRWFGYVYAPLALVAAVGAATVAATLRRFRTGGLDPTARSRALLVALVLLACLTPYAATMLWNHSGSMDDPVLDASPMAQRLSTTPSEAALYEFTAARDDGTLVVGDRVAVNHVHRGFGHPNTRTYLVEHGRTGDAFDEPRLVIDRAYAHSRHAKFRVEYRGRLLSAHGSYPKSRRALARDHSIVYAAGPNRLLYAHGSVNASDT